MSFDVDEVRGALRVDRLLDEYGVRAKKRGKHYRVSECPGCLEKTRDAVSIHAENGWWQHFGHARADGGSCSGDVLDLLAALEGLDRREHFTRILERGAQLAGVAEVSMSVEEREQRRAARDADAARRRSNQLEESRAKLERAHAIASEHWESLARSSRNGETYLRSRGLDPAPLMDRGIVRFTLFGDPSVALFGFDGRIVGVARRRICHKQGEPKMLVPAGCVTKGTLIGSATEIAERRIVIVTEGIIDALTAAQLWPDALVLGAQSVGQLRNVVRETAPSVRDVGGVLVIVPDADPIGERHAIAAVEIAIDAGLQLDHDLLVVEPEPHHDLNSAHVAGWKP